MKRIIGCPTGEWAMKLYTVDRFKNLEYFLDEYEGEYGIEGFAKKVHTYDYLENEKKDDLIIVINDTRKYKDIKDKLEKWGLIENRHFFNGWKLDGNFYHEVYADKNWKEFEHEDLNALRNQREGWKMRAREMALLIPEDINSLMDIGCGEGLLKEFIRKDIKYYGLDYCKRDKDTIVCDINTGKLPDINVDLYYLAGVIDYVIDVPKFIKQFDGAKYVIISKTRNERFIRLDDKVMDSGYMNYGVNSYYCSNLITDMFEVGFVCKKMQWNYLQRDEYYFLFENYAIKGEQ